MIKKAIKKLLAALLAVAMLCAMAVPAFAATEDISNHSFSAFQIFKGDVDGSTLSNVDWGSSISATHEKFLQELKKDATIGTLFENADTLQKVLDVMKDWHTSDDNSIAFARFVFKYLYSKPDSNPTAASTSSTSTINFTQAGYYLIVDTSTFTFTHNANNAFLLNVTKAEPVTVNSKAEKPSVEKKVYDNDDVGSTGENDGWHSSADHAINEAFKFKLTATVPASADHAYDYYDTYSVIFHDTLSTGITFDTLDNVEITNGSSTQEINASNYALDKDSLPYFTLGIENVKTCAANLDLNQGATITVTYTAHLNEKAYVNTKNGDTKNTNKVYLTYSNNPKNSAFWGKTPESEVYVFTYQLNNTKYRDSAEEGNELKDAGFRLYSDSACTEEQEIKLKQNEDGTYSRNFSSNAVGVEMKSAADGTFNVKGLDAGTYYLKETSTPTGFNTCPVTTVVIKANHTGNDVNLTGSTINSEPVGASSLSTTIVNNRGTTLPSTGGIGTTLFYVVGGGLMVAAIVLLVTKKRMENK